MLKKIKSLLSCIRTSVHTTYGSGLTSYLNWLHHNIFAVNTFYIIKANTEGYNPDIEDVNLTQWNIEKLSDYRADKELPKQFYMDKLLDLREAWVVLENDEVIYILWKIPPNKSRFLLFENDEIEVGYSLTMPQHRRKGLHRKCHARFIKEMGKQGYKYVYGAVHDGNTNSMRSLTPAMQHVGKVMFIGRIGLKKKTSQFSSSTV